MKAIKAFIFFGIFALYGSMVNSQSLTATQVLVKSYDQQLGETSISEMKMRIVRPEYEREVSLKNWSYGKEYYIIYIMSPARDKGQVFLKRENNMWNWLPKINRMMKIPPSMMSASWMGSDFSNNDLVRERTFINDYESEFKEGENKGGFDCYSIELIPKPEAPVVWSKVQVWIDKKHFNVVEAKYYNELDELVTHQVASDFKDFDGRYLPAKLTMIPVKKPGQRTEMETISMSFDEPSVSKSMFSIQNMKRIKP
ncbi:outer membrane lipoprotein-sorting protein [Aureibacter tunicatorum]|uniref:Uncharacterized protein TP-0789 domain-containing protein n=1 Tax=Aureibacter tunicatorum TaxID=866807 RepID=A0AAE3XNP6_9BACT|nr:outer membrane lipoprotein-sorting protein [Aureibacter tunicatorum]MDR6238429.1 hypothetical protein [Aureibacter tunicatorum]BDD03461.1 outer membrane lipoprotein-sorting protein [Aureibacter tunicatorum]